LRTTAGAVSIWWKTRGAEWPVCERVPSRAIVVVGWGGWVWVVEVSGDGDVCRGTSCFRGYCGR
jgi:hypothetical protein